MPLIDSTMSIKKVLRSTGNRRQYSIIIPTWNNLPYLKLCLRSLQQNSHFQHQIILHINEGKDGTLEWVKNNTELDYTHSDENIGICYANNIAASLAQTDYIVYLNDDMYACPDWDLALDEEIQQQPDPYFFLSGTMIEPFDTGNPCVIVGNFGTALESFEEERLLKECKSLHKTDWMGATWPPNIVPKVLWDMVGGYSSEFFPGFYSDPDFSKKLWDLGVRRFKGIGASKVYHFASKSTKRIKANKGSKLFLAKWGLSSSTFTKYYLKRGAPFSGVLGAPSVPSNRIWKDWIKRKMA